MSDVGMPSSSLRDNGRAVYGIEYHVLLVTRRRKALFAGEAERSRCEELLRGAAEAAGCEVACVDVQASSATLHVHAPPTLSAHALVQKLRGIAGVLKDEFDQMRANGAVFVRRYMATTYPTEQTDCDAFVREIPRRS